MQFKRQLFVNGSKTYPIKRNIISLDRKQRTLRYCVVKPLTSPVLTAKYNTHTEGKKTQQQQNDKGITVQIGSQAGITSKNNLIGSRMQFQLSSQEVQEMLEDNQCSQVELLTMLIDPASELARPPISDFRVGAVGLGGTGAIYVGVNLEFGGLPLYHSVHAEQFLIVNALHHNEKEIQYLAITAAPCGHCRQFCCELACADDVKFIFEKSMYTLQEILPHRFGPQDLLNTSEVPLLLQPQNHQLTFAQTAIQQLQQRKNDNAFIQAAELALTEARRSYAPYSKCPSGVSVITKEGGVYGGGCIESAAFNPSLAPLQTALIDAVIDGMPCYTEVKEVVVVEMQNAKVEQAATIRTALGSMAPDAEVSVLYVQQY
eukprot:TRINITY_DN23374_c0_g1_i2.p1 TRINITY_DN23374_c0_g1~~TRINITY_DN23374_c0_g1_i2.p1  ORF type:complete len:374 (-),score=38.77 TRINITY_DN23374_c0_g1_i2:1452-2573(-)